jgi:plastocyanin
MGEQDDQIQRERDSRRRFLQSVGAASALVGAGGLAGAQETTEEDGQETTPQARDDVTTIVLGGRTSYWLGLTPSPIEGEQNPTLKLREGEQYRLVWVNLDGMRHELHLEDDEGNVVHRTEAAERVGATRSVTFEADESLAGYRCEYHPEQMVGSVELGEGFETTTEETTTAEDGADGEITEVAVGPEGEYLRFVPEEVEISVGDAVRWTFESEGHNVTAKPEASTKVELPEGVEPFATYEGNRSFMVVEVGETFEHTFTVPGTYVYVCAPHSDQGMVGRVIVSE